MISSLPADQVTFVFDDGLPASSTVGVQVQNANTGTVALGRTTTGVTERPTGSGIYVVTLAAPIDAGLYLVTVDWNSGNITPSTSRTDTLLVSATVVVASSALGSIADAAKSHLASIFDGLVNDPNYGAVEVTRAVEVVKYRVMTTPPVTADEDTLPGRVVDYLGYLVAIELLPAAYASLSDAVQSQTTGSDPSETYVWVDKLKVLEKVEELLLRWVARNEAAIIPLIPDPVTQQLTAAGPKLSDTRCHVTANPQDFPRYEDFPHHHRHHHGSFIG